MSSKPKKTKAKATAVPIPRDDSEARSAIREIGDLSRQIARAEADLNDAIAALQEEVGHRVEPLQARVLELTQGVQMFCEVNRDRLTNGGKTKTVRWTTGEVSWRLRPAKVSLRKVEEVIAEIKRLGLARKFLRQKEEVNKEAMLSDPERARTVPGVTIGSEGEDFQIEPFETELPEGV